MSGMRKEINHSCHAPAFMSSSKVNQIKGIAGIKSPMQIASTIIPIFLVVMLGWAIHRRGFLPGEYLGPANRLVFYVAIPAMIFQSIAGSTFSDWLNPAVIAVTLLAAAAVYFGAWTFCRLTHVRASQAGTFVQSAGHGNLGYIGLAVAFYFLGDKGLISASVVAGFLMIVQNMLSVLALQAFAETGRSSGSKLKFLVNVLGNPVILAVLAGMIFSGWQLPVPLILKRSLSIISGLALPTALLIIGASLSIKRIRADKFIVVVAAGFKLLILPAIGWALFNLLNLSRADYLPALILLASPTATVSYVMAREMHGDGDLAVATVSASTLLSALTFIFWLHLSAL